MEAFVRDAEAADYSAVEDLATDLAGFDADRRAAFDSALQSRDHDLIVAELSDEVVGFAHLLSYDDVTHGARAADLLGICVRADCRRQGIGAALLREVIRRARQRQVGELHVSTEPDNDAALRLYRRHGAETVGTQMEFELG